MRTHILFALLALTACDTKRDTGIDAVSCVWYQDDDGDGWGTATQLEAPCDAPPLGWASDPGDCDDTRAEVFPGAAELCNELDDDCDGFVDDADPDLDLEGAPAWYPDLDQDGFGDEERPLQACVIPDGLIERGGDCDDGDPEINPDIPERCNGFDDDCDGDIDEDDAVDAPTWQLDGDGDGYGDPHRSVRACEQPADATTDDSDCDDSRDDVFPGAAEYCDGADNDCDGVTDEDDALDAPSWFADADGDAFGDPDSVTHACSRPTGYVADDTDCDDTSPDVSPAADEWCNGYDDDCDGVTDEDDALDAPSWHRDADGDGFGDPGSSAPACSQPSGTTSPADATDCDDADAAISPAATEICDRIDNDCDGLVDDDDDSLDTGTASIWYIDTDADGYGDGAAGAIAACIQPSGTVSNAEDCRDDDAGINPSAIEICDDIDNDCDGLADDDDSGVDLSTGSTWYADSDGDGYGDAAATDTACDAPSGYVDGSMATDCDDGDGAVNPAATEICNGYDDDCDGLSDDDDSSLDSSSLLSWFVDGDGDGYGDPTVVLLSCAAPSGAVESAGDCDDTDGSVNPGAAEICDTIDNDCDGAVDDDDGDLTDGDTWWWDGDLDGYGDSAVSTVACEEPSGYVDDGSDCDDGDANINPDASETCDGEDDDCDGYVDDSAGCPCRVETYDGAGYMFCASARTWDYADRLYSGYGYLLASVSDASEQAWIFSTISGISTSKSWWIGANDKSRENTWVWDSGEGWSYTNWAYGQPDNGSYSEDCANMSPYSGQWNDEQCWTSLYAVYEAH